MDKNTIWAIVLSTLVIIAFTFIIPMRNLKNNINEATQTSQVEEMEKTTETDESVVKVDSESAEAVENQNEDTITENTNVVEEVPVVEEKEELITVDTGVAVVTLSTKGGDIVSYQLKYHTDKDTNAGIQIADSVTELNRACGIALGAGNKDIVNDIFNYKKVNENTYGFIRHYNIADSTGNKKSFDLIKTYTFMPNEYMFKLDVNVNCDDDSGLNFDGAAYTIRTAPQIGPHYDSKNKYDSRQFIAYTGKKAKKIIVGSDQFKPYEKDLHWGGIAGKYFVELIVPSDPAIWNKAYYSSKVVDNYSNAQAFFERTSFTSKQISDSYYMYYGPRSNNNLKIYNSQKENGWNISGYKLTESLQTSGWLGWLEFLLRKALEYMHIVIKNYGVCIIILTILLKLAMFPLSKKQSMSTLKMQELQPKIQQVQKKYANDQQKQQQELAKIYQEAGYNPASGCLPMLFTFLVLIALYSLFNNYFEFRGAEFIKGWIPDLSVGDSVLSWERNIPVIGFLFGNDLRILPIVYVASQILFSVITQNGGSTAGQNSASMKFMTYGLPVLFFFLFYSAPAGLLLYWITSNIFQMVQQLIINNMMRKKKADLGIESDKKNIPNKKGKRK